jgi:hypothetical protein
LALSCSGGGAGGGGGSGDTTETSTEIRVEGAVGSDPISLTIDGKNLNLNAANASSGMLAIEFPKTLRDADFSSVTKTLNIPQAILVNLYKNRDSLSASLVFNPQNDSFFITQADMDAIRQYVNSEIAAVVKQYTTVTVNGVNGVPTQTGVGSITAHAAGALELIQDAYANHTTDPVPVTGTVWGNDASLLKNGSGVAITVQNKASAAALNPGALLDTIASGDTVTVTFAQAASGSGQDRISFGKIAELRAAISAKGVNPAAITMQSSAAPGEEVAPLFNGDDLFGLPGYDSTGSGAYGMGGKVFAVYANGDTIFEGFTVRNSSAAGTGTGWYIDKADGKTVYVEKLRWFGSDNYGYLNGFGLKAQDGIVFSNNPVLSGEFTDGSSTYNGPITPAHLDAGFALIGMDYSNTAAQLFDVQRLNLKNAYSGVTTTNLASYPNTLKFIEKHVLGDKSKIDDANKLVMGTNLVLQKTNPYTVNAYSGVGESDKVNGNLAVWLGSKGVALKEVYLTNPTLYTSSTNLSGEVRNVVFDGNNWANININLASGVVVSKNTPVRYLGNGSNSNLWYVVQGQSDSGYTTQIVTSVLEVGNIGTPGTLVPANATNALQALITANSTVRSAINSNFTPITKDYVGTPPVGPTWQTYAEAVKNNTTPPVFQ